MNVCHINTFKFALETSIFLSHLYSHIHWWLVMKLAGQQHNRPYNNTNPPFDIFLLYIPVHAIFTKKA